LPFSRVPALTLDSEARSIPHEMRPVLRLHALGVLAVIAAVVAVPSAPSAPAAATSANVVLAITAIPVTAADAESQPPAIVPSGGTKTIARLSFAAGVDLRNLGPEVATATVRFELPAGLRWGTDPPDPSENCTSSASNAECTTTVPLGGQSTGWIWDVAADQIGGYALRAEIVSASTSDPDVSNNSSNVTIVVTEPTGGGGGGGGGSVSASASAPKLTPATPKAGSLVAATVRVTAGGTAISPTRLACIGTVGGAKLTGAPRARPGSATCLYRPPKTAKGKLLRGTISFMARGTRFTRRFSARLG
jgi:hypothetical protein